MATKTFINEKGNKITVSVRKSKKAVKVKMTGPKSTMTNNITPEEARVLKNLL